MPVLRVLPMVLIVEYRDSERQLLVIVTEFVHEKRLWVPPGFKPIMRGRSLVNLDHVTCLILSSAFDHEIGRVVAEAEPFFRRELRRDLELDDILRLLHFVRPHSQSSPVRPQYFFARLVLRQG